MSFEKRFRFISYLAVFCGFLALWISGTFGAVESVLFVAVMIGAWFLEDSRWQISERIGTALIVLALPVYYVLGRYQFFDLSISETMKFTFGPNFLRSRSGGAPVTISLTPSRANPHARQ